MEKCHADTHARPALHGLHWLALPEKFCSTSQRLMCHAPTCHATLYHRQAINLHAWLLQQCAPAASKAL
jgi:hypothetical protein